MHIKRNFGFITGPVGQTVAIEYYLDGPSALIRVAGRGDWIRKSLDEMDLRPCSPRDVSPDEWRESPSGDGWYWVKPRIPHSGHPYLVRVFTCWMTVGGEVPVLHACHHEEESKVELLFQGPFEIAGAAKPPAYTS